MNNGKICVSICAETTNDFIEKIERAADIADIVELRFDCLNSAQIQKVLSTGLRFSDAITTFRPKSQGGKRVLSIKERKEFWTNTQITDWCDIEHDLIEGVGSSISAFLVCSYHDFEGVPQDLSQIYENLKTTKPYAIKIAAKTTNVTDSIAIWSLLKKAKAENQQMIPIAMGEAGKWTRILGLAHGAPLTYASLEDGDETAPRQISAKDLFEVYRVKELDKRTEVYGIIGSPVSQSLSPYLHNEVFKIRGLKAVYIPFETSDIDEFLQVMVNRKTRGVDLNFRGFSVTIPHKSSILKHLDFIDEVAKEVGAVNTVKIVGDKLHGFNTDANGFIEPLKKVFGDLENVKVAIAGAGGAARACVYALQKEKAAVTVFGRNMEKAASLKIDFGVETDELKSLAAKLADFDILVNATPLGTKGKFENESVALAKELRTLKLIYDLVYNPRKTKLMKEAEKAGVPAIGGLEMLIAQAAAQQKLWTGFDAPVNEMRETATSRLAQTESEG